jgi:serine/threonine protein kinase
LIPDTAVELNWSGHGQHVEFERSDKVPLEYIAPIGVSMNAKVDKVKCRRIMLARKIMKCDKHWSLSDALIEVEHLHRLRHAHIVQLVGTYLQHRDFAILLYPAADWDLSAFMNMSSSCLPPLLLEPIHLELLPDYLSSFFPCLASALEYVHNNTTRHCDIKPSNILVKYVPQASAPDPGDSAIEKEKPHKCAVCGKRYKNFNGLLYHRNHLSACNPDLQPAPPKISAADENPALINSPFRVYLADFGISQTFVSQDQSQTDSYTGRTPKYCAPEVYENLSYGRKADVFSLGCVFAEMYTVIAGRDLDDFEDFRRGNGPNGYFHANIPEVRSWIVYQIPRVLRLSLKNKIRITIGNSPSGLPLWRDIDTFPLLLEFMLEANPDLRPAAKQVSQAIGEHWCCITGPEAYVAADSHGSKAN